jgi:hypothetical protein
MARGSKQRLRLTEQNKAGYGIFARPNDRILSKFLPKHPRSVEIYSQDKIAGLSSPNPGRMDSDSDNHMICQAVQVFSQQATG